MQSGATKSRPRRQSGSCKKTGKIEPRSTPTPTKPVPVKRAIKDKRLEERAVRFRSTDEEYVFEIDSSEYTVLPVGSDIFQKILKDMKDHSSNDSGNAEDDDVFDGVFTAKIDIVEKKADTNKSAGPKKSILKRRNSNRR